jgi:hypothetical protein
MSKDFRNFIYVSQTKLDQYIGQIEPAKLTKIETETKFKAGPIEQSIKTGFEGQRNKYSRVQDVVKEIERRGLMGDLLDYRPWFRATVPVKAILLGQRVFYVGRLPLPGPLKIEYAFQCSVNHLVGIENFKDQIDRHGIGNINLPNITLTVPSITSTNHSFATALFDVCRSIESSEPQLSEERDHDPDHFRTFFASKEDYELFQANTPTDGDYLILKRSLSYERDMFSDLFRGWFGGYRKGLVDPPPISIRQSFMNLMNFGSRRRFVHSHNFAARLTAFRRLQNFNALLKRANSDGESRILDAISSVAGQDCDQAVEIVGMRLLDGYYRRDRSRSEKRVILASPLYLSHASHAFS